jgi:type I restriction enzyme M protein
VKARRRRWTAQVAAKYKALSEDEIKALVVDDKWLAALAGDVQTELDRIAQGLSGRVKELAEGLNHGLDGLSDDTDWGAAVRPPAPCNPLIRGNP